MGPDGRGIRREMAETRATLVELPDPNRLVAFDRNDHAELARMRSGGSALAADPWRSRGWRTEGDVR